MQYSFSVPFYAIFVSKKASVAEWTWNQHQIQKTNIEVDKQRQPLQAL